MAMLHIVCNYCEDIILDTHSFTIYEGSIYHWLCLVKMKEEREKPREPSLPESIDGRDGVRRWDGKPLGDEPSVFELRKDSTGSRGSELPRLRRFLKWLFRRKT